MSELEPAIVAEILRLRAAAYFARLKYYIADLEAYEEMNTWGDMDREVTQAEKLMVRGAIEAAKHVANYLWEIKGDESAKDWYHHNFENQEDMHYVTVQRLFAEKVPFEIDSFVMLGTDL